jgi:hypothetical protein
MNKAVRDCLVTGYEPLIDALELPDPDDMEAKSPDDFILDQIDLSRETVYAAVQRTADSRQNPPATFADVLAMLERDGLVETSAALRPSSGLVGVKGNHPHRRRLMRIACRRVRR